MAIDQELFGAVSGVDDGTGENPVNQDATTETGDERQPADLPKQGMPTEKPKVNLDELDEFRAWKSQTDKKIAQYESNAQRLDRERQEALQRLQQYEGQLEQLQTKDLDDYGKAQYENQKLRRQMELLQQQMQQQQIDMGRQRLMSYIQEQTGVPVSVYAEAQNADQAWAMAAKHLRDALPQQAKQIAQQRVEKQEANAVDIGGGASSGIAAELQQRYENASKSFNTSAVLDIMNEADAKGVRLKL